MKIQHSKDFIESAEYCNPEDKDYTDGNAFLLALGSYGSHKFVVCATNLQDALEVLGSYCKTEGYTGLLEDNYDTDNEFFDEQYFPVNGGEFYLCIQSLYCEEVQL